VPTGIDPKVVASLERKLKFELGPGVALCLYDRSVHNPMNFVLDRVEARLQRSIPTFWVDGGAPEVFCLRTPEATAVVFSRRHFEITALLRQLMLGVFEGELLVEIAERACLKIIGELALKHGNPDLAVLAYLKAEAGKEVAILDPRNLHALETSPVDESYMLAWFFGLVHELGHIEMREAAAIVEAAYPDSTITAFLQARLEEEGFTEEHKPIALEVVTDAGPNSIFAPAHLREEAAADTFACDLLLRSTIEIMAERDGRRFDPLAFAAEHMIIVNVMGLIERCSRVARVASARSAATVKDAITLGFYPQALHFRMLIARQYLDKALACPVFKTHEPSEEQEAVIREAINKISIEWRDRLAALQKGFRQAMRFALAEKGPLDGYLLLESFRFGAQSQIGYVQLAEARGFCDLAASMGVRGDLLDRLRGVTEEPERPAFAEDSNVYFVPWVEGPDGFSRPFGVDTDVGNLVFVFRSHGRKYRNFFEAGTRNLKPGFKLEEVAMIAPTDEILAGILHQRSSEKIDFGVVIEGSEAFAKLVTKATLMH
jgi:hypothetical protein